MFYSFFQWFELFLISEAKRKNKKTLLSIKHQNLMRKNFQKTEPRNWLIFRAVFCPGYPMFSPF